eukprot:1488397-Alexandrium_andersonii.AAC.1
MARARQLTRLARRSSLPKATRLTARSLAAACRMTAAPTAWASMPAPGSAHELPSLTRTTTRTWLT